MRPEDVIQSAIVDFILVVAPQTLPYAIPNASRRTENGHPTNAVPGILPGMPDIGVVLGQGRTGYLEVKTAKGVLRPEQVTIGERLVAMETPYAVVKSIPETRAALAAWGVETREHVA